MEKFGYLDIRVVGKSGNDNLTPNNYDIRQIALMLKNVEDLLYPNQKKERPIITYDLKQGSALNRFTTSLQYIIGFSAILTNINATQSIDFMDSKSAEAIENIQKIAQQTDYQFFFSTSLTEKNILRIDAQTSFLRTEVIWVEAEFYLYGTLKNAGGKEKANIHLDTEEYGYLKIALEQDDLRSWKENPLYKQMGVRVSGKQNIKTGELDKNSLRLIELIDYDATFEKQYLEKLIKEAKPNWIGVDVEKWLHDLRGGYER